MTTITEQAAGPETITGQVRDAPGAPGLRIPGFTGQGWSTHETMLVVRWLFAHPDAWDQAMAAARADPGNPHTVADTLHEHLVPRSELDAIAAAGFDPAKVNWLEVAHELIERRDDPRPDAAMAGGGARLEPVTLTSQAAVIDLVGAEGYIHGYICVRPPCGKVPARVQAAGLSVKSDGTVIHKASGYAIGSVTRDPATGGWQAAHAGEPGTVHGSKNDAVKAVSRRFNSRQAAGTASAPASAPVPAEPARKPSSPAAASPGSAAAKTISAQAAAPARPAVKSAPKEAPRTISPPARPAARTADIRAILAHPAGADVKKDVAPLFEGKYGDFTVKIDSAVISDTMNINGKTYKRSHNIVDVKGTIYDKNGKRAGIVEREFLNDRLGTQVSNAQLELLPKYQGQGFASDFYKQTEARLKAAGVQKANIHADLDVGGYAWARKGFDWRTPADGRIKIENMAQWYKNAPRQDPAVTKEIHSLLSRAQDPKSAQFPTPYDVSRVGYTPGASTWPGKQFMLGGEWYGVKNL